jgi:hypothetical protein
MNATLNQFARIPAACLCFNHQLGVRVRSVLSFSDVSKVSKFTKGDYAKVVQGAFAGNGAIVQKVVVHYVGNRFGLQCSDEAFAYSCETTHPVTGETVSVTFPEEYLDWYAV